MAARVQIDVGGEVVTQGLVKALWSDDSALTTRINPAVAHYTGQAELAQVIQEGLAAKAGGDEDTATFKLGRAAKLAAETGNEEATQRLKKIVDIEDADTGTVRLKRDVSETRRDGPGHQFHQDDSRAAVLMSALIDRATVGVATTPRVARSLEACR